MANDLFGKYDNDYMYTLSNSVILYLLDCVGTSYYEKNCQTLYETNSMQSVLLIKLVLKVQEHQTILISAIQFDVILYTYSMELQCHILLILGTAVQFDIYIHIIRIALLHPVDIGIVYLLNAIYKMVK